MRWQFVNGIIKAVLYGFYARLDFNSNVVDVKLN